MGLDKQVKKAQQRNVVLEEIIKAGAVIRSTSIGRVMYDPRTCTCTVKGRTDRDHAEDCAVEPVVDSGPVVAALRELRLNQAFLLSLEESNVQVDTSQLDMIVERYEAQWETIAALTAENNDLRAQLAALNDVYELPALPPGRDLARDLANMPANGGSSASANGHQSHAPEYGKLATWN